MQALLKNDAGEQISAMEFFVHEARGVNPCIRLGQDHPNLQIIHRTLLQGEEVDHSCHLVYYPLAYCTQQQFPFDSACSRRYVSLLPCSTLLATTQALQKILHPLPLKAIRPFICTDHSHWVPGVFSGTTPVQYTLHGIFPRGGLYKRERHA